MPHFYRVIIVVFTIILMCSARIVKTFADVHVECSDVLTARRNLTKKFQTYLDSSTAGTNMMPTVAVNQLVKAVVEVNEKQNMMILEVAFSVDLVNCNFQWDPKEYCGINRLNMDIDIPEKLKMTMKSKNIMDSREGNTWKQFTVFDDMVLMKLAEYEKLQLSCVMDSSYWPYHVQVCKWSMVVQGTDGMTPMVADAVCMVTENAMVDPMWEIRGCGGSYEFDISSGDKRTLVTWKYLLTPYPKVFLLTIIIPLMLVALASPLFFLLPADAENRTDLLVAILLTNFVALAALIDVTPVSRQMAFISYYTFAAVTFNTCQIISSVVITRTKNVKMKLRLNYISLVLYTTLQLVCTFIILAVLGWPPWPDCQKGAVSDDVVENTCQFNNENHTLETWKTL